MKKTEQKYQTYVQILKEELIPAMGCTEPISLAYGASLARKVLNHLPTKIVVEASGSIIKNVKSVIVPHTHHLKGIKAAVCAGIIGGNDDKYLEVLSQIDEKTKKEIDQYIEKVDFEEHFLDSSKVFDYIITVWNKKEYVKVRNRWQALAPTIGTQHRLFPVPMVEIKQNPHLQGDQNPGLN